MIIVLLSSHLLNDRVGRCCHFPHFINKEERQRLGGSVCGKSFFAQVMIPCGAPWSSGTLLFPLPYKSPAAPPPNLCFLSYSLHHSLSQKKNLKKENKWGTESLTDWEMAESGFTSKCLVPESMILTTVLSCFSSVLGAGKKGVGSSHKDAVCAWLVEMYT